MSRPLYTQGTNVSYLVVLANLGTVHPAALSGSLLKHSRDSTCGMLSIRKQHLAMLFHLLQEPCAQLGTSPGTVPAVEEMLCAVRGSGLAAGRLLPCSTRRARPGGSSTALASWAGAQGQAAPRGATKQALGQCQRSSEDDPLEAPTFQGQHHKGS